MERSTFVEKLRRPGKPAKFPKADDLWDKFLEYCEWIDNNPWQIRTASNSLNESEREKGKKSNGMRQDVRVLQRPFTLQGFATFAGISRWNDFKKNNQHKKYFNEVISAIENVVLTQQLDGALLRQFDGALVARLNNIADRQVTEITGKDGEEFKFPKLTISDIEQLKSLNGLE